ncbi:tRNA (N6-isopentenyl adenosine(37)-C2)-methylthiotransferase MiaB [Atopobium fossor]|uniref:tRNA (N6-isopentenyl adenosine(37)-C2)-methylthiotransferase MiaB n=1 Tax=Atopobium fossor TaxID=39487 RepID=UPI0003FD94D3|nr:tRNA (N6-isopentenyl adenosine(37)-C2)-methylthiotransferase MiaB [Atopobium fossor]
MADFPVLVGKTYSIKTFGCQMNLHDSERVSGLLDSVGMNEASSMEEADADIFMTCCVREKADTRLYGQVSSLVSAPIPAAGKRVVAVGGCIAQRDGENLRNNIPNVDVVFGTQAIQNLPHLLTEAFGSESHTTLYADTEETYKNFSTDLPSNRVQSFHAWLPIMTGCNNFCSYCIVPYVRGRENSRDIEDIVIEAEHLVHDGVREITLLGQNVNSYGRSIYGEPRFAELLRRVGNTGIERLRFTSSHPKDLSTQTIAAMAETPAVMPHLHLAVQSGSTNVLRKMNRRYTREDYLRLVDNIRASMPDIALSTDIIVGFPGETEEDFKQTLSLIEEVGFSSAFTFIYSKRPGTPAEKIIDPTPHEVIQERFERLAQLVSDLSYKSNQADLHTVAEVLVEGLSKSDETIMVGHSRKNQTVHFPIPEKMIAQDLIGKIVDIQVDEARTWYLRGPMIGDPR